MLVRLHLYSLCDISSRDDLTANVLFSGSYNLSVLFSNDPWALGTGVVL